MTAVMLLIDPAVLGTGRQPPTMPGTKVVEVQFGYYSADGTSPSAPFCDRCGVLLHHHEWQFVTDMHVIDCGRTR